jgi:hypothetical protein
VTLPCRHLQPGRTLKPPALPDSPALFSSDSARLALRGMLAQAEAGHLRIESSRFCRCPLPRLQMLTWGFRREHLYRCHKSLTTCPRCRKEFAQEDQIALHLNSDQICDRKSPVKIDDFTALTEAQMKELKRRNSKLDEIGQWEGIYKIIFPNEPTIPSPC